MINCDKLELQFSETGCLKKNASVGWSVVLGFNATLTAKVI